MCFPSSSDGDCDKGERLGGDAMLVDEGVEGIPNKAMMKGVEVALGGGVRW